MGPGGPRTKATRTGLTTTESKTAAKQEIGPGEGTKMKATKTGLTATESNYPGVGPGEGPRLEADKTGKTTVKLGIQNYPPEPVHG